MTIPPGVPDDGARDRLGRNVRWLALLQLVMLGVRFAPKAYLARKLGLDGLGQYYLGLLWLELISDLHGMSQEDFIPRDAAQDPGAVSRMVTASLAVIALATPLIALGVWLVHVGYADALGLPFLALFIASVLRAPTRALLAFYAAVEDLRPFSLWQSAERLGIAVGTIGILLAGGDVAAIFWLFPVLYVVLGVPVWIAVPRRFGLARPEPGDVRRMTTRGVEFTGLKFVSLLYGRIDVILVERLLDLYAAGLYSAVRSILDLLKGFPMLVTKGLYPVLSRRMEAGPEAVGAIVTRFEKMMLLYALPLCTGGSLVATSLVTFLFGGPFAAAGPVFALFVWTLLFGSTRRPLVTYLTAAHRQNRATVLLLLGVVINVCLTLLLVPRIGVIGAAWAVLVHEAVSSVLLFAGLRRDVSIAWGRAARGPIVASILMGVAVWMAAPWPLLPRVLLGALTYGVALVVTRGLDPDELTWVKRTAGG